jgi:hypothetical protein
MMRLALSERLQHIAQPVAIRGHSAGACGRDVRDPLDHSPACPFDHDLIEPAGTRQRKPRKSCVQLGAFSADQGGSYRRHSAAIASSKPCQFLQTAVVGSTASSAALDAKISVQLTDAPSQEGPISAPIGSRN